MSKKKKDSRETNMVSRRDFLKTSAVVTAGVAAGSMVGASWPKSTMAQSPFGTINVVTSADADSYDPHSWISDDGRMIGSHIFESLVTRDYDPMLATSWENPDKLTWIFHLKRGVEFTNGEPFNASVVKFNLERYMDPKTKAPHPRQRIELAMEEAAVHVDPFKPVSEQVKTIIEVLRPVIPISMEHIRVSIKIPSQHIGKAYGIVRNYGTLEREDWQSDGSWIGIVKLPPGMQTDFYDKLNEVTKGNISTKILK